MYKGLNGAVSSIVKDSLGNIYAGGSFTEINGVTVNHIAKWNALVWREVAAYIGRLKLRRL